MRKSVACLVLALAVAAVQQASAQLAPIGEHYAGRPSDTGYGGSVVNATGAIAASVPLEFPPARGGSSIPLQVVHRGSGVGAAGLGWDLPLSYIQRSTTFAYRRPAMSPGVLPEPRERAYLSLFGQSIELVADGSVWIARSGTLELTAIESAGSWLVYDGRSTTYAFQRPSALGSMGLWLLASISKPGNAKIELSYQITEWGLDGGPGTSIDLVRIDYNHHPLYGCPKNEIALNYGNQTPSPRSMSILGERILVRVYTLTGIDVSSRASCDVSFERLRRYDFQYTSDQDTGLPRLRTVQMSGRQGTPEESTWLPIASYGYGSATTNGVLRYQTTQQITLPTGVVANQISGTALDSSVNAPEAGDRYAMWQTLIDVNGDGRPDFVFKNNNKLWVAFNRPDATGTTTLGVGAGAIVQLSDSTFSNGALSTHTMEKRRYVAVNSNRIDVWRQEIDVNGDGRIDVIDAAEEPDHWVVYLNTPGGPTGVQWQRRSFSILPLLEALVTSGHLIAGHYVPLSRRVTGTDIKHWQCWRFDGTTKHWEWYSGGFINHRCQGVPDPVERGPERTFIEWQLVDLNGDGYPDFVFNSTPIDFQDIPPPIPTPEPDNGAVLGGNLPIWVAFAPRSTNEVRGALNVRGVRFYTDDDPFAQSFNLIPFAPSPDNPLATSSKWGVGEWTCAGTVFPADPCDESLQNQLIGFADVNGDGLVDRVVGNRAYLGVYAGTAVTFSPVYITLPGPLATQHNTHKMECAAGGTPTVFQRRGLRDLTGDGIPDYYDHGQFDNIGQGQVWIGTGSGFRQSPVSVETTGAKFNFSNETEDCGGITSNTDGGLYDIDGDGRPEVLGLGVNNTLFISSLVDEHGSPIPQAGRLTEVDNGYGAKTTISYDSAKRFTDNPVPFPEIVVSAVATSGTLNLGANLAGALYAYGNAELIYDSVLDRFFFPGYRRTVVVSLSGTVLDKGEGIATITDTWPLTTFAPGLTSQQRWQRTRRAGHVRDVLKLRGPVDPSPWSMLNVDANDSRAIGVTHHEWDAKLYQLPVSATQNIIDCIEMVQPLDFGATLAAMSTNAIDVCRAHGFAFETSREAWYGAAQPPADENIQTLTKVLGVDDFGRATAIEYDNDLFRSDDDFCVENAFATPTGTFPRALSALASRRAYTCGKESESITVASESFNYDGLPPGLVSDGRVTSHTIDRRTTDTGAVLSAVRVFDAAYDTAGNLTSIRTQQDSLARTTTFEYDEFGLVTTYRRLDASGIPQINLATEFDPVTLQPLSSTDVNQTKRGIEFDGFGRPIRSTITPLGGVLGVETVLSYLGFDGTDPDGRRINVKRFNDPVTPATVSTAAGQTGIIFFDEFSRKRKTELELGSDYANAVLVVGSRVYDLAGRVSFTADPYLKNLNPATAYGTSYHYNNVGDLQCLIRGQGWQPLNMVTDSATERFPSCFEHSFAGHVETLDMRDAASLQAGSPQAGVIKQIVTTAIGRVIERSTLLGGTRLEHATFAYDQLGQQTSISRFLDPVNATSGAQWSWQLNSMGHTLQLAEPNIATRFFTYSDWGEPIEIRWVGGGIDRRLVRRYDALSRLTSTEERNDGVTDPETVNTYTYDAAVNVSSLIAPTFVLGHLASAASPSGQVAFSYDALGHMNAQVFADENGGIYLEKTERHADGRLAALEFNLPDQNYQQELVKLNYDSVGRVRTMTYADPSGAHEIYSAQAIDAYGRVRGAVYGGKTTFHAIYANQGRQLIKEFHRRVFCWFATDSFRGF